MTPDAWANAKLSDLIREKNVGMTVNVHVVTFAKEPQPDFEHMQRVIEGEDKRFPANEPKRDGTD